MFIPRAIDYLSTLPSSYFPTSGNDTLTITCTPGPCGKNDASASTTAQCLAVFSSLESGISQSLSYCASQTPDTPKIDEGLFWEFLSSLRNGFSIFLIMMAYILAFGISFFAVVFIIVFVLKLMQAFLPASWTDCLNSEQPNGGNTNAAPTSQPAPGTTNPTSTSGSADASASAVEMNRLATTNPNRHTDEPTAAKGEDHPEENESDDATQWDDAEDAHLLLPKAKVDE